MSNFGKRTPPHPKLSVRDPTALPMEAYLADPAWRLPKVATEQPGTGWTDAAARHDEYLYDSNPG